MQETLNVNVNVLKLAKGNAYQELERFIRTFDPKWRADENIILILCAIVLFTPDRPRVIHQDVIKLEQVDKQNDLPDNIIFFVSELVLLPITKIFGKYLCGMRSQVHLLETDPENHGTA